MYVYCARVQRVILFVGDRRSSALSVDHRSDGEIHGTQTGSGTQSYGVEGQLQEERRQSTTAEMKKEKGDYCWQTSKKSKTARAYALRNTLFLVYFLSFRVKFAIFIVPTLVFHSASLNWMN